MDNEILPPVQDRERSYSSWAAAVVLILVGYVLSSGPVIAAGCWLRDVTGWERFYAVFWLYAPLLFWWRDSLWGRAMEVYLVWWLDLFGTMAPG
jgi:hypothetical protein